MRIKAIYEMRDEGSEMRDEGRRKKSFRGWVPLVGKMFPHLVGVFCGILGVPSGHMGPKSDFLGDFGD